MARALAIGMTKPMFDACCCAVAGGHGGVDADDLAGGVDERPAGVAGADRGVGLDQAGQLALAGVDRAAERRHDALGHRRAAVEGEGVADRHDLVADGDVAGGERRRHDAGRVVELEHGDVVAGVATERRWPSGPRR